MNVLVAGDFCPKDRTARILNTTDKENVLKSVIPIVRKCDFSVVNLECPLVSKEIKPIVKCGPNLKSSPAAAQLLKHCGFSMATLANNHIMDYGPQGLYDTLDVLKQQNLAYVGVGENIQESQRIYYYRKGEKAVAFINCCEHEFSIASEDSAGANPLNPMHQWCAINEAKRNADYTIVIVHGGHEHYQLPSPRMQETYRFFVDAGADVVINHHQHCYSGFEIYKGKPIFYGLGNFCFDWEGKRDSIWNYGYMVELEFGEQINFLLHPYEQCNHTPEVRLLNDDKRKDFEKNILHLNSIIKSSQDLKDQHEKWMGQDERGWLASLNPFTNRYITALTRRKMFPLWFPKKNLVALLNKVACESHRDVLVYILTKQFNKNN